ncbi:Gfo/Idh/MocA family oxidoreductase [Polymorphobacter sp. PAMC 29334]|uniref:Gfo/Idh/MocA family protein n=1 Tax=Polymorphobacter sp. PAMC 29334 TaxID=2862331 RepID=UPI001C68608B|nr:Gfo/Idh/MocA family oxidoreductase [Polymorphobacter sp. PAMC 29334]QYE34761.1 Gfo/Idh/MocA family oxidoreductase [Polymorphobacter sp. PAMC 29334]
MGDTIRWGIVGAGMMAIEHIANLKLTPGSSIVALVDPVATSIERAQAAIGADVTVYADPAALAASGTVDAVLIASPNFTHHEVLGPLLDARLNILCEKPLATTLDDARDIAARVAGYDKVFWTGMEYRYMPPAAEFIAQVHRGRVGHLKMLSIREHRFPFLVKVGDWNRFNRNTGGTMVEKCCHFFDLMRVIVESEPVRVFCSGAAGVNHRDETYGGEVPDIIDNSFTTVDFANGVRAMLDLSMFADGAENQEEIVAVGDAARLDCLIPAGEIVYSPRVGFMNPKRVERSHVAVDPAALSAGQHHGATFYQHQAFAAAVRGDGPVAVTADDGLRAVAIGIAAEISAREHRVVEMGELGL